ncbi:RluA family pseudouridine synthase [Fibrobacterota bacterium]
MLTLSDSWTCAEESDGQRLDKFLAAVLENTSRTRIQDWLDLGCFLLNDKQAKKNTVLKTGDTITVRSLPELEPDHLLPQDIPLDIQYEDDSLLVVNKPKGLVVHPGSGNRSGTLANALAYRYQTLSSVNDEFRPGIVHRLDKNTSGLMLVAKTNQAHISLARQLESRLVKRTYRALVWRQLEDREGTIDKPIGRHPTVPVKMSVVKSGREAVTRFRVVDYYGPATLLKLNLESGRTHQIRVHLSSIGHPVIGDPLYGGLPYKLSQVPNQYHAAASRLQKILSSQALHAESISFTHPRTNDSHSYSIPLPEDFRQALEVLEPYRIIQ